MDIIRMNVSNLQIPSLLDLEVVLCTRYVTFLHDKDGHQKEISQIRLELLPQSQHGYERSASEPKAKHLEATETRRNEESKPWLMDGFQWLLQDAVDGRRAIDTPFQYCLQLACGDEIGRASFDSSKNFIGRLINPDEIEIGQIKQWLDECQFHHGPLCNEASWLPSLEQPVSLKVLDVHTLCVVKAPKDCQYVALSYVWGATSIPQPRIIGSDTNTPDYSGVCENLPRTIQDAILLTRKLGKTYLWVDSLCISQEDDRDKIEQIGNMDTIYGLASFTIVAAAGSDANAGLPGVRPGSRSIRQIERTVQKLRLTSTHSAKIPVDLSQWNRRAWTFQERLLSKRCLIFTDHQVYFQCKSGHRSEDTHMDNSRKVTSEVIQRYRRHETEDSPVARNFFQRLTFNSGTQQPTNLTGANYDTLVAKYTSRQLTYPSDALNAFRGVEKILSKKVPGRFFCGLPTALFDEALLWQPVLESVRSFTPRPFPSWSWASWDGPVEYTHRPNIRAVVPWLNLDESGVSVLERQWMKRGGHPDWGNDTDELDFATDHFLQGMKHIRGRKLRESALKALIGITKSAFFQLQPCDPPEAGRDSGLLICKVLHGGKQMTSTSDRHSLIETFDTPVTIAVPESWMRENGNKPCEFVLIAMECRSFVQDAHVMLIDRHEKKALRIGLTKMDYLQWTKTQPRLTMVELR
jgi:hypothetical protein